MESISSENLPVVWHTLNKIELAIGRLQERTAAIHNVNDFLLTPSGMEKCPLSYNIAHTVAITA